METSTVIEASIGGRDREPSSSAGDYAFLAVSWFERVDAEGLLEASPPRRGDERRRGCADSLQPAEIEVARGGGGPHRTRDVWTSLGPIEAESAKVAAVARSAGSSIPNSVRSRVPAVVISAVLSSRHDILASDERIGEINAEATRKVVVADSGRTQRALDGIAGGIAVSSRERRRRSRRSCRPLPARQAGNSAAARCGPPRASPPLSASRDGCWRSEA